MQLANHLDLGEGEEGKEGVRPTSRTALGKTLKIWHQK